MGVIESTASPKGGILEECHEGQSIRNVLLFLLSLREEVKLEDIVKVEGPAWWPNSAAK